MCKSSHPGGAQVPRLGVQDWLAWGTQHGLVCKRPQLVAARVVSLGVHQPGFARAVSLCAVVVGLDVQEWAAWGCKSEQPGGARVGSLGVHE